MNDESEGPPGEEDGSPRTIEDLLWGSSGAIGTLLIVISAAVMVFTFPMRFTHTIFIKALIPIFGVPFAVIYICAQVVLVLVMRSCKGLALAAGLFVVGMGLGWVGMSQPFGYSDVEAAGFSAARHILCGGACVSGLALGIALVKGWLYKQQQR